MNKIMDIYKTWNLQQLIDEPTHFTETSSLIIDLILVNNVSAVEISGVSEPFLLQDIRYRCPELAVLFHLVNLIQNRLHVKYGYTSKEILTRFANEQLILARILLNVKM